MQVKLNNKVELRLQNWKNKAVERGAALRAEKKRSSELIRSRAQHKEKWKQEREKRLSYESELKVIKSELHKLKNHSYDLKTVWVCLAVKNSGTMSLRACRSAIITLCMCFYIELKVPCINTIRNWEQKSGFHQLNKRGNSEDKYVIIIDESYSIGRQSLLLILGVNLSTYQFGSSLAHQDIEVLGMGVKSSWKSKDIEKLIATIEQRGYQIVYSCSDGCNNLVKALKDKGIPRVYDCTHALSLEIKKRYEKQERFIAFQKKYALFNRQNYMSQDRLMCPPKLRGKSRFLNIYPMAEWAGKWIGHLEELEKIKQRDEHEKRMYKKLLWLRDYRALITELVQVSRILKIVFKILKNKGLNTTTIALVRKEVEKAICPVFLREGILNYLEQNSTLLTDYESLICCSDVIESLFGKFKNNQKRNPEKGITIGCLDLINYGQKMDKVTLKKAMEETRIIDLKQWRDKNNLQSFNNKRRSLVKKWGNFF